MEFCNTHEYAIPHRLRNVDGFMYRSVSRDTNLNFLFKCILVDSAFLTFVTFM